MPDFVYDFDFLLKWRFDWPYTTLWDLFDDDELISMMLSAEGMWFCSHTFCCEVLGAVSKAMGGVLFVDEAYSLKKVRSLFQLGPSCRVKEATY